MIEIEQIEQNFTYHKPKDNQPQKYEALRSLGNMNANFKNIILGIKVLCSSEQKRQLMVDKAKFFNFCSNVGFDNIDIDIILEIALTSEYTALEVGRLYFINDKKINGLFDAHNTMSI